MNHALHAAALATINLGAIVFGFAVYNLSGAANQIEVQVPVAAVASVLAFLIWTRLLTYYERWNLPTRLGSLGVIYGLAFVLAPALFVVIHALTQGYLTSAGNIVGLWLFQAPVNLLTLLVARLLRSSVSDGPRRARTLR